MVHAIMYTIEDVILTGHEHSVFNIRWPLQLMLIHKESTFVFFIYLIYIEEFYYVMLKGSVEDQRSLENPFRETGRLLNSLSLSLSLCQALC